MPRHIQTHDDRGHAGGRTLVEKDLGVGTEVLELDNPCQKVLLIAKLFL
ncbi:MAG: hypothetical protein ACRBFS_21275 [Aureispira sp.]